MAMVVLAILLLIFMQFDMAHAQDIFWEQDDVYQGATRIYPNGVSLINNFSFSGDIDWYWFSAEQNVTYQIFTRPKNQGYTYHLVDTIIYLYADPTRSNISRNDDFKEDGSSLIQWTCSSPGTYYVRVKNFDVDSYGQQETYTIQITSLELQNEKTIIQDVPDYSQSDFGDPGNCGPVAAACVLGYWAAHGYPLLVDSDPEKIKDVERLVHELQEAMDYPSMGTSQGGVRDEDVPDGIERVCNAPNYNNQYDFESDLIYNPDFFELRDEILNERPVLYGVIGHSIWQEHWFVTMGFLETSSNRWTINHDTWSSTHRDIYVDWDEATDCIVTIHPKKEDDSATGSTGSTFGSYVSYPISTIPYMVPGLGMWPVLGIGNYSIMPNLSPLMWPSPFNPGYTGQSNWGGFTSPSWSPSSTPSGGTRVMASNNYGSQIPLYGYNYGSFGNNYEANQTSQSSYGFTQGNSSYSGNSSYYSMPSQGTFNNMNASFFPSSQMMFPASRMFAYPMFSPLFGLSFGYPILGFPF